MKSVIVIAFNTFKEAIRNRILYIILIFSILIIMSAGVISDLSVSEPGPLIRSIGLWGINFFSLMIAVFIGIGLVYNEIDKKTIYTIVSKPIDRTQFLLGKYFGLLLTIYVNVAIMTLFFFTAIYFYDSIDSDNLHKYVEGFVKSGGDITSFSKTQYYITSFFGAFGKSIGTMLCVYHNELTQHLMKVILLNGFELAIIVSFAVLFSSFSTPILSAFLTIMTFLAGRGNDDIFRYALKLETKLNNLAASGGVDTATTIKYYMAWLISHLMPNLSIFHQVSNAIYEEEGVTIYFTDILYGLCYPAAVLVIASMIFRRRNFK